MRVIVWVCEGTWRDCIDPARGWAAASAEVVLLHVTGADVAAAAHGAFTGLLGRSHRHERDPGRRVEALSVTAAQDLLTAAAAQLARPAALMQRNGRVEHEVVQAATGADLLICARDGDRTRLGPHS